MPNLQQQVTEQFVPFYSKESQHRSIFSFHSSNDSVNKEQQACGEGTEGNVCWKCSKGRSLGMQRERLLLPYEARQLCLKLLHLCKSNVAVDDAPLFDDDEGGVALT